MPIGDNEVSVPERHPLNGLETSKPNDPCQPYPPSLTSGTTQPTRDPAHLEVEARIQQRPQPPDITGIANIN
jgi:hypothetical protein